MIVLDVLGPTRKFKLPFSISVFTITIARVGSGIVSGTMVGVIVKFLAKMAVSGIVAIGSAVAV